MRLGRWIGVVVGLLVVAFAMVMLVMMQRQLEKLRDARAGASAPAATTPRGPAPKDDALPPGAMR